MTTETTSQSRIYVASLSDYNAGRLHGRWIDADIGVDAIEAEVKAMLAESPEAKLCQWCGDDIEIHATGARQERCRGWFPGIAEEWAIHDFDGDLAGIGLTENETFEHVATLAEFLTDKGAAGAAWLGVMGRDDLPDDAELIEKFDEVYQGEFLSGAEFAQDWADSTGMLISEDPNHPNPLFGYVDWAQYWHGEFECAGWHIENGHVFSE
jgi:antirestriction protein